MDLKPLFLKYNRPGPRYTSYPTAPHWTETVSTDEYRKRLAAARVDAPYALYVHIPFCESLCYYCGCNIKITHDATVAHPYVDHLIREIEAVAGALGGTRELTQISWGGGTPTFLGVGDIVRLHRAVERHFRIHPQAEISIEIDPRVTSLEQLGTLRELGFNRVSLGVQDFDPEVQRAVNRMQSAELTGNMLEYCRGLGFTGINYDLIYGLPHQTLDRFRRTLDEVVRQRPDRIALYNYAHLPTLRPHQKILEKYPMPEVDERVAIFNLGFETLTQAGYVAIGMDHFAVPDDELSKAVSSGALYRNFMGYTVKRGANLIGIGASAIGELEGAFFQSLREVPAYQRAVASDGLATFRGCLLSADDLRRKWIIQNLMCRFEVVYGEFRELFDEDPEQAYSDALARLDEMERDGLIAREPEALRVTPLGRLFVRNAAMNFDAYLSQPSGATYSRTL